MSLVVTSSRQLIGNCLEKCCVKMSKQTERRIHQLHRYVNQLFSSDANYVPNPHTTGCWLGKYKMMQKAWKWLKLWQMGTHLRVLSESYPINTKMTGRRLLSQICAALYILYESAVNKAYYTIYYWTTVAIALEGISSAIWHTFSSASLTPKPKISYNPFGHLVYLYSNRLLSPSPLPRFR